MALNIGYSDIVSIGQTYVTLRQTLAMAKKPERTVWMRVKEALIEAGMAGTQKEAARIAGMEQGSVSDWNKPGRFPTIENAAAIARATNVCIEWLLLERGPKHPGPPEEPAAIELWKLWPRLPDVTKGRILGIASENASTDSRAFEIESSEQLHRRSG